MKTDTSQASRIGAGAGIIGLCVAALATLSLTGIEARAAILPYGFGGGSSVFTVSCSGSGAGGLPNPGIFDNRLFFTGGADCTADPFTATANSNFTLGNVSASGSTTASADVVA